MEIKEVEKLLSISRSNIRFYEKQGLLSPERRTNNYRNYTEEDILSLKKIIVLRKLGFSVEEISLIQSGEIPFSQALPNVQAKIEAEIEHLNGSLNMVKSFQKNYSSFEDVDFADCWENIQSAEKSGEKFINICRDYLKFELGLFDHMWKFVFFHDFKNSRKKHGILKACIILLLICIVRGIGKVLIWHESFWSGFLYPWLLALAGSVLVLPLYILSKKAPKIASAISAVLLILILLFFVFIVLLILYGIIQSIIS